MDERPKDYVEHPSYSGFMGAASNRLTPARASAMGFLLLSAILLAGCGGGDEKKADTTTAPATTGAGTQTATTASPGFRLYRNERLGVSFEYPRLWEEKEVEPPGVVAFGNEVLHCSFLFDKGLTADGNQVAYARERANAASKKADSYKLIKVQPETGENVEGAGILRTSTKNGESTGGHIAFFFAGGNRYSFDCLTDKPRLLESADQEVFKYVISSLSVSPPGAESSGGKPSELVTVKLKNFKFVPNDIVIKRGGTLKVTNATSPPHRPGIPHNLTIERGPDGSKPSKEIAQAAVTFFGGETDTYKVNLEPGKYAIACTVPGLARGKPSHREQGMHGTLTVVE